MKVEIGRIVFGSPEHELELGLRNRVLREPLGLRFSAEELEREAGDIHIGAFEGLSLVGCLLLARQDASIVRMRQVAVAPECQGRGVGRQLVLGSEEFARLEGYRELTLHARLTAVPFYLALGYERRGEIFQEIGLPHQIMRKTL